MGCQILLCLSLVLSIHGGALQPLPAQPPQASFAEGTTAILPCPLERGNIQEYHAFWFLQKPGKGPVFILKHHIDGKVERAPAFDERFVAIRDANTYMLQIRKARTEDSATYYCLAEANYFNTAVSGSGTQLSVTGGKSAKEPASVTLLSDAYQTVDSPTIHALCIAEKFYPGFLEIKWSEAGVNISEGVTAGAVVLNEDGSYSASSILSLPRSRLTSDISVKCSTYHIASGTRAERSLEQCQGK
ncbi:Ig heavy chain Mem5-like [Podarcis raffonei]|uniref:Ig heavy chain Mem5-like n=1 Tax=Podarcis raffonei TaxID=65483 RepID=UPI0023292C7E|nr:Ig heavy chain Mem5-like [Podarcis raffonei]